MLKTYWQDQNNENSYEDYQSLAQTNLYEMQEKLDIIFQYCKDMKKHNTTLSEEL